jgi:hypothetical protein
MNKIDLFSYWLFIWFLFFYFGLIKTSPLIFYIFAIICIIIIYIITGKYNILNLLIKLIFSILSFKIPLFNEEDLLFGFFLAYIYIIFLLYNNKNPIDIYIKVYKSK